MNYASYHATIFFSGEYMWMSLPWHYTVKLVHKLFTKDGGEKAVITQQVSGGKGLEKEVVCFS